MNRYWFSELSLLGVLVVPALLAGWWLGGLAWWLLLAVVLFLVRWARELYRLEQWLASRRRDPPQGTGLWGHVFDQSYRMRRRHVRSKKRLARVIREFRESTAAMPDGALVLDREFRIAWCNDAACSLLGLTDRRDMGQPVGNLIRSPRFIGFLERGRFDAPIEIRSPVDDSRTLMLRLVPYGHEQYLLLARDVTRIHRLQAMRRDFVANASHELRSPLTVLAGYLDMLASDSELDREWNKPVAEMQAQCRRMTNLIDDLLELSRLETEEVNAPSDQVVDVPVLIRRIVADTEAVDERQHDLHLVVECDYRLLGVERELYSAMANLIINACRYSPKGTPVDVCWRGGKDGEAIFEVRDRGIGIEPKYLPFITQRFYRVDSSHSCKVGGTGLGLAIVKHVLNRHGGRLEVDSEPDKGSTFRCVFPAERLQ